MIYLSPLHDSIPEMEFNQPSGIVTTSAILVYTFYLLTSLCARGAYAELPVFVSSEAYDNGDLGKYPVQHFESVELVAPRPNLVRQDGQCAENLLTFLTPRGNVEQALHPQATILDHQGHLVWTSGWENKQIYNLMTQEYRGHKYLTFWAGNDAIGGHGDGSYYMVSLVRRFLHLLATTLT